MAHLALTDVADRRFHAFERFSRGALGLAGARGAPLRVWLEDWSVEAAAENLFPLALRAAENGVSIELTLEAGKPAVLQGDAGLSRKGATPGNASYYYSLTRLPTRGRVEVDGRRVTVVGTSWLDREWSTSALEAGVVGWDWFALQLSDGRDLMYYRLRRAGGGTDPASGGTLVEADGSYRGLRADEVLLEERRTWRSPETGVVYPSGWRLTSATAGVELAVEPLVDSQEHTGSVLYWEGAVGVSGTSAGGAVDGVGYVELTGYPPPG
jgi:predicted secreted hydrolase